MTGMRRRNMALTAKKWQDHWIIYNFHFALQRPCSSTVFNLCDGPIYRTGSTLLSHRAKLCDCDAAGLPPRRPTPVAPCPPGHELIWSIYEFAHTDQWWIAQIIVYYFSRHCDSNASVHELFGKRLRTCTSQSIKFLKSRLTYVPKSYWHGDQAFRFWLFWRLSSDPSGLSFCNSPQNWSGEKNPHSDYLLL